MTIALKCLKVSFWKRFQNIFSTKLTLFENFQCLVKCKAFPERNMQFMSLVMAMAFNPVNADDLTLQSAEGEMSAKHLETFQKIFA